MRRITKNQIAPAADGAGSAEKEKGGITTADDKPPLVAAAITTVAPAAAPTGNLKPPARLPPLETALKPGVGSMLKAVGWQPGTGALPSGGKATVTQFSFDIGNVGTQAVISYATLGRMGLWKQSLR